MTDAEAQIDSTDEVFRIPVDPEPASLRFTLFLILIGGFIAGYAVVNTIFTVGACNLLAVFGGLVAGAVLMQAGERYLKPRWESHKSIEVRYTAIDQVDKDERVTVIDPTKEVEPNMWYFEVPRRTRVPKGWYVVGFALEQDELYLPVYTLISPQEFNTLPLTSKFTKLTGGKGREKNLRLAGQQRRLLRAETARNMHGVEMSNEHFSAYLKWLQTYFPEWMPQS